MTNERRAELVAQITEYSQLAVERDKLLAALAELNGDIPSPAPVHETPLTLELDAIHTLPKESLAAYTYPPLSSDKFTTAEPEEPDASFDFPEKLPEPVVEGDDVPADDNFGGKL